ncbi:single-strand binding protein [[Leptolyngbya] sp. PCC 7376]|uniref:single-stranded DNA-binding protein n=1 Tax=[Leptolyngbya] sp. PCC 7376 TaxID=111781 RepID=UPI00029ED1FD|nr:single-stranded DNA-binding protein [[Leptolyngbya] sp. PCC 7376]AFY39298.1 single-strand binding protein [[Leptolyngbya] sp. PCC 7376]
MNSCVLMAQIMSEPELRYTPDNTPLAQMLIQFPALRDGDPACQIKAIAWGNMGTQVQESYHEGDQVILVGRLSMNTIDRPEGFKEKKAEFVVSQIQSVGAGIAMPSGGTPMISAPVAAPSNVVPLNSTYQPAPAQPAPAATPQPTYTPPAPAADPEPNLDDIPF